MEIIIKKPTTTVKIDKRELQLEKMHLEAIKQAATYRVPSISVPAPANHVIGYKFYIGCLYALGFTTWFICAYFDF